MDNKSKVAKHQQCIPLPLVIILIIAAFLIGSMITKVMYLERSITGTPVQQIGVPK